MTGAAEKSLPRICGVEASDIELAWEEALRDEDHDERAQIRAILDKKYDGRVPADPRDRRRAFAYLARRGFEYEDIMAVFQTCTCESEEKM